jgi:g-D-glutamyl-meso-diaminopimelate peptidase
VELYRVGRGRRNILFVGAHHGSEYITGSLLYELLIAASSSSGEIFGVDREVYYSSFTLWVVPVLNCDGVSLSAEGLSDSPLRERLLAMSDGDFSRWKANARGVDLNHNYAVGFDKYKLIERERGITPGATLYSGEYPESEPESRALADLARSLQLSLSVSLHSQGEEIYAFPKSAERVGRALADELGYRLTRPEGTAAYGGFSDFTAGALGIPSLTLEVGRGENPLGISEFLRIRHATSRALFLLPTRL